MRRHSTTFTVRQPHGSQWPLVALTFLLSLITGSAAAQRPTEHLEIVLSNRLDTATHRASGFLGSISPTRPSDVVVRKIAPQLFRLNEELGKQVYRRVTEFGAAVQMVPSFPGFKGPTKKMDHAAWMPSWERHLERVVDDTIRRRETWQWDLWNEPNGPYFWVGTRDQYLETWRRSYAIVRSKLPKAVIVGPSIASYDPAYLQAFLRYAKSNDVLPDVLSWHELTPQSPGAIVSRVAEMRRFLADNHLPISRIQLNEIVPATHQFRPGMLVWFFAAVERAGVEAACKSCWLDGFGHNCINDSLNGLLSAPRLEPRSAYWAYAAYAEITGQLIEVVPSRSFDGLAGIDSNGIRVLLANHDGKTHGVEARITGFQDVAALARRERVRVVAYSIPNTERKPLSQPVRLWDKLVPIVDNAVHVEFPQVEDWGAISLVITPI